MEGKFLLLLILLSCLAYSLQTEDPVEEKVEVEPRKGWTVVPRSDKVPYKQH